MGNRPLVERQKTLYGEYLCPDENGDDCAGCLARKAELKAGGPSNITSKCLLEKAVLG